MVPDEQPKAAPEQSASPASPGPRRRSRRGGRRHSRRREPRPPGSPPAQSPEATDFASDKTSEEDEPQVHPLAPTAESANSTIPAEVTEQKLPPLRPAPVVRARDQQRQREPHPREPQKESPADRQAGPKNHSITQAIEQVNEIISELKSALDEMDDVLETLELAERQKIDDEREIENLQRALRRLNRPRDDDQRNP